MRTAAISVLKAKLSEHIALVKRGEEVIVTERGKPVARIIPIARDLAEEDRLRELVARGAVRLGRGGIHRRLARLPICRVPAGSILRIMEEEREDRV